MSGQFSLLATFGGTGGTSNIGIGPVAMIQGSDGNLYFTNGIGVYKISNSGGAVSTVYSFTTDPTTMLPSMGTGATSLLQASDGNFYITLTVQPNMPAGSTPVGAIARLTPDGQLSIVHTFASDSSEGNQSLGPLVQGPDGYLYGMTAYSGNSNKGVGMAFKVLPSGSFISLGQLPGGVTSLAAETFLLGDDGNFYGTTILGGDTASANCAPIGCGTIFQMTPGGAFTVLHNFEGGAATDPNQPLNTQVDGATPWSPIVESDQGDFFGASEGNAHSVPALFELDTLGRHNAPVQVTVNPTTSGINQNVTINWKVLNAFSTTAQQCGAYLRGGTGGGNWSGQQTGTFANGIYSGTATVKPTKAGKYTYALVCGGYEAGFATLEVSPNFQITSLVLPQGQVNDTYSAGLTAIGGQSPYTWSVANLPQGLALDTSTGIISGKPLQFGDYSLAVTATDSSTPQQQVNGTVTLKIVTGLTIETTSVTKATIGAQYNQKIRAQFGLPPYQWTITGGTLPHNVNFTSGTPDMLLSGIPTATGNYTFTVQVADSETNPATQNMTFVLKVYADVEIAAVEFTQAIQQYQTLDDLDSSLAASGEPPVPLVAGEWAVMRVYFTRLKDKTDITLSATGSVVGVKPFSLAPGCDPIDQRAGNFFCKSLDFYFIPPPGAWSTVLTLKDDQDNQLEQETLNLTSRTTSSILYKGVSICSVLNQGSSCQNPSGLFNLTWFASKILPTITIIPTITARRYPEALPANASAAQIGAREDKVTDDMNGLYSPADAQADTTGGQRTDYVGVYNGAIDSTGVGVLSGNGLIIPNQATRQGVDGTAQILAHETGHTLGLTHTGTNIPSGSTLGTCWGDGQTDPPSDMNWIFINNRLQSLNGNIEYGFDTTQQSVIDGGNKFDVMAYCIPRWVSPYNYKNMFPALNGGNVTSPNVKSDPGKIEPEARPKPQINYTLGSYIQVGGTIPSAGIVLNPIFTESMLGTSNPGGGTYSMQELGAGGAVLYTRNFTPTTGTTDTIGSDFQTDPIFNEFIPFTAGTASIAVLDPTGNTLISVALGTPPTVTITSPAAGFIGSGQQNIAWTAASSTSTTFYSRIYYSIDNGITWADVLDTSGTNAQLDFSTLPPVAQHLRFSASMSPMASTPAAPPRSPSASRKRFHPQSSSPRPQPARHSPRPIPYISLERPTTPTTACSPAPRCGGLTAKPAASAPVPRSPLRSSPACIPSR
ncbi:MAG TPA: choice-of-anchor tandem repeat GloVer-containing protein [Terracidiphilus sp.]|nr:choice-of-anchor tandem repeat GloVer-containing protein [Terracidiphilus sp.]